MRLRLATAVVLGLVCWRFNRCQRQAGIREDAPVWDTMLGRPPLR